MITPQRLYSNRKYFTDNSEARNIIDIKNDTRIIDADKFIDCLCLVMAVGA